MHNELNEIPSSTPNFRTELAEKLAELVPEAIADGKIDTKKLEELLDGDAADTRERFGLFWPGKKRALRAAQESTTATLVPDKENSKDWDTTQNVFIEGDNLEVLKILQKHYHNKIKMIYIDPPYNTGKDFVYPDNYKEGLKTYMEFTKQVDEGGKRLSTNSDQAGRYHSNWLNMMYPRLKLARNLLKRDGVILISIDHHESAHLRRLCDEVFGEANFIEEFVWVNEGNIDQQSKVKGTHEYIIAYARSLEYFSRPSVIDPNIEEGSKLFRDQIENSITKNGPANPPSTVTLPVGFPADFTEGIIEPRDDQYPHVLDLAVIRNGKLAEPARVHSGWSSRRLLDLFIANGCEPIVDSEQRATWFELRETGAIYGIKRRSENQGHVLSVLRNMGTTKRTSSLLGSWGVKFTFPKPTYLLEYLITVFTAPNDKDMVLDFFAGSGTTAQAVMMANVKDGGNRRHLQVQLPEPLGDSSGNTIADLARKRVNAARKALRNGDLGARASDQHDLGYRAYTLSDTNFTKWRFTSDITEMELEQRLLSLRESADGQASPEALLVELLLKGGYSLTEQIDVLDIAGLKIHGVKDAEGDYGLLAYLNEDEKPTLEQLRELVDAAEVQIIMLEDAFKGDDQLKTNLAQLCKSQGVELWAA